MSNDISPEQTIINLYAEIQRLEEELKSTNDYIWRNELVDDVLREGFKKWVEHLPQCNAIITQVHEDCTCGLAEFILELEIK